MPTTRRNVVRGLAAIATSSTAHAQTQPRGAGARPAAPSSDFTVVAKFTSASSGAHWVTPFGIPFKYGTVPASKKDRIFARYPAGPNGKLYSVQTEQFKIRGDGTLIHCTGHMKLPAGYTAREIVEIGYSETAAHPPPPNWEAITKEGADFVVKLSIWEPRIHFLMLDSAPIKGDKITIEITDSKGKLTYTHAFQPEFSYKIAHDFWPGAVMDHVSKLITQDPNGRYACYMPNRVPAREGRYGTAEIDHFLPKWQNTVVTNSIGTIFNYNNYSGSICAPRVNSNGAAVGYANPLENTWLKGKGQGAYIFPRWKPGEPEQYTVRATLIRAAGSTLQIAIAPSTLAIEGVLKPVNDDMHPRQEWVASFKDATATPDSPWFMGHQIFQAERRVAFVRRLDRQRHEHLEACFRVSWDRDGKIVDRQVTVENTKLYAAVRDYWYDAEILVDGIVQTANDSVRYRYLYHTIWTQWRWAQKKVFGMVVPGDFMRARLVFPWTRYPTENHTSNMACKLRGSDIDWGTNDTRMVTAPKTARPFVRETLNDPLYEGAWDFGFLGGARAELGCFSTWEWWFWSGDTLATWDSMEAQADNVMGAIGFNVRDNTAIGEDALKPPNMYTKWDRAPHSSGNRTDGKLFGMPVYPDQAYLPHKQLYVLRRPFYPAISHFPSSGIFSAYIVRPEKHFFDAQEQFTWYTRACTSSEALLNPPKKGGKAGDPDHVIGYQTSNGNRSYAWPLREILRASFIQYEGARRAWMWKRVAQDQANHFNEMCRNTIWGIFESRSVAPNSDNWRGVPHNDKWGGDIYPTNWNAGRSMGKNGTVAIDAFKSAYVNMTVMHGMDLGAADFSEGIQLNLWQLLSLEDAPPDRWFMILGNSNWGVAIMKGAHLGPRADDKRIVLLRPDGEQRTWDDGASMKQLFAWYNTFTNPKDRATIGLVDNIKDMDAKLMEAGYSYVKQQHAGLYMTVRYHRDPKLREKAEKWAGKIEATWPRQRPAPSGFWGRPMSKLYQQLDFIPESEVVD